MLFQRCYSFLSVSQLAGNIKINSIVRCFSRNNRLHLCLSKQDSDSTDVKLPNPSISSESIRKLDGRSYASKPTHNFNSDAANTISVSCTQSIVTVPYINDNSVNNDFLDDSDVTLPKPLDVCTEDLSDVGSYLTPTFSFAKYANQSHTIQELVKLGVELYKLEEKEGMVQYILDLDFERDIKPYIIFLHDCGVSADKLGYFITRNPYIFKEDMNDLHTRIRYLRSHEFSIDMIKTIVCKNPKWLLHSTKDIDGRLGYFQNNFQLKGYQVRLLTVKGPKVVTHRMLDLMQNTFSIREEMELNKDQIRKLLLGLPRLWIENRAKLMSIFEYAHNEMKLSCDFIVQVPHILTCRKTRLQQRHMFLVEIKKAQYDPSKPLYVSPRALISGTDVDFCRNIAMTSVDMYNAFLKTF